MVKTIKKNYELQKEYFVRERQQKVSLPHTKWSRSSMGINVIHILWVDISILQSVLHRQVCPMSSL
mgnify:CR=1 FL=1